MVVFMNQEKTEAFVEKTLNNFSGALVTIFAAAGDKLGLFQDLAEKGPASSQALAERTGINERYAREWLHGMTCAEYIEYDPGTKQFSIPPENVPVLAREGSPSFLVVHFKKFLRHQRKCVVHVWKVT
jgi:DNA-binding IclR family transcriptional regulator